MGRELTRAEVEELKIKLIFSMGMTPKVCDCETCPYLAECERDNPDFDANYCKVS